MLVKITDAGERVAATETVSGRTVVASSGVIAGALALLAALGGAGAGGRREFGILELEKLEPVADPRVLSGPVVIEKSPDYRLRKAKPVTHDSDLCSRRVLRVVGNFEGADGRDTATEEQPIERDLGSVG